MGSRWFGTATVLLWLSTMTWLVESKVLPPMRRGEPPDYRSMYSDDPDQTGSVGWDMLLNGRPLGWAYSRMYRSPASAMSSDRTTNLFSRIHFDRIPLQELSPAWMKILWSSSTQLIDDTPMDATSTLMIDSLGHLSGFDSRLRLVGVRDSIKIKGVVQASRLKVTVEAGEFKEHFDTYLPADALVTDELSPQSRMTGLRVGQEWTVPVFSPLRPPDNPIEILQARVEDSDPLMLHDEQVPVVQVVYRTDSGSAMSLGQEPRGRLWVGDDGNVLRQEVSILGSRLVFLRTSAQRTTELEKTVEDEDQRRRMWGHRRDAPAETVTRPSEDK